MAANKIGGQLPFIGLHLFFLFQWSRQRIFFPLFHFVISAIKTLTSVLLPLILAVPFGFAVTVFFAKRSLNRSMETIHRENAMAPVFLRIVIWIMATTTWLLSRTFILVTLVLFTAKLSFTCTTYLGELLYGNGPTTLCAVYQFLCPLSPAMVQSHNRFWSWYLSGFSMFDFFVYNAFICSYTWMIVLNILNFTICREYYLHHHAEAELAMMSLQANSEGFKWKNSVWFAFWICFLGIVPPSSSPSVVCRAHTHTIDGWLLKSRWMPSFCGSGASTRRSCTW